MAWIDTAGKAIVASTAALSANNPASSVFGLALQTANFAALIQFLETQGSVQVLSSPRVATINNQKAVLKVGTDEFFVTNVSTTTSTTGTTTQQSPTITVAPFFSGILLDVTPRMAQDSRIMLHIHSVGQFGHGKPARGRPRRRRLLHRAAARQSTVSGPTPSCASPTPTSSPSAG